MHFAVQTSLATIKILLNDIKNFQFSRKLLLFIGWHVEAVNFSTLTYYYYFSVENT